MTRTVDMGLFGLDWFFTSDETADSGEIDPDLLFPITEQWIIDATQAEGDELNEYRWQAAESVNRETGGGFWRWLRGE